MSVKIRVMFLIFAFGVSGILSAQNAQELRFGSMISGNLREGAEIWYSVRAVETCFLTVETSGDTDTLLGIYDSSRKLILDDDDGGNDLNAKVEILAEKGSNYLVKLTAYEGEAGAFRIMASYAPLPDAVELAAGSTQPGNIIAGKKQLYRVRTAGSGFLVVETLSGIDTYLDVYDSSYNFVGSNDDGGNGENARFEIFAEANKIYYFVLRGYDSSVSGPYQIQAGFEAAAADNSSNTERSKALSLKLGEAMPVTFSAPRQSRWFVYEVTRTGVNFVVQTRGRMDTLLVLYNSRGDQLEEDDDSGEDYNAMISSRLAPGTYYIEVKEYSGEAGRCTLHAEIR
jgi:hypothetical protein